MQISQTGRPFGLNFGVHVSLSDVTDTAILSSSGPFIMLLQFIAVFWGPKAVFGFSAAAKTRFSGQR